MSDGNGRGGAGPVSSRIALAEARASLQGELHAGTRLPGVRRLLGRVLRLVIGEQVAFNHAVVDAITGLSDALEKEAHGLGGRLAPLEEAVGRANALSDATHATLGELQTIIENLHRTILEVQAQHAADRSLLLEGASRMDALAREAKRRLPEPFDEEQLTAVAATMRDRFPDMYAAFEERFRGSRGEIRRRLAVYLPDIAVLRGGGAPLIDIGSGRGEWLELLAGEGITAYGVDSSEPFATSCRELGLDVRLGDGIGHLESLTPGTVGAITAFHVVEHLDFPVLVTFLDTAFRALRPGGLLLLETPNPQNVAVGSANFYLDPTHKRPLHQLFLHFLVQQRGFVSVTVRPVNAEPGMRLTPPDADGDVAVAVRGLVDRVNLLLATSPDYAVLSHKPSL